MQEDRRKFDLDISSPWPWPWDPSPWPGPWISSPWLWPWPCDSSPWALVLALGSRSWVLALALSPKSLLTSMVFYCCRPTINHSLFEGSLSVLNCCCNFSDTNINFVMQLTVFRCWSSKTSTDQPSSTVRGRSLKSDSTTREATTGLATNDYISWQLRFDLQTRGNFSWHYAEYSSFAVFSEKTTTEWRLLGTRVTQEMHFRATTGWCLPHLTVTTTRRAVTVQCTMPVDSGTGPAQPWASTLCATRVMTSDGVQVNISCCRHLACGWRARSLHWNFAPAKQNESCQ